MESTNYFDTLILVADDCPVGVAEAPPRRDPPTAAQIQYDLLVDTPYVHTSDDVVYESNGRRRGIDRETFFSKGQPCLRSSPLTKRYGFGVHSDAEGRVALLPVESERYRRLADDPTVTKVKAMRSSRR